MSYEVNGGKPKTKLVSFKFVPCINDSSNMRHRHPHPMREDEGGPSLQDRGDRTLCPYIIGANEIPR